MFDFGLRGYRPHWHDRADSVTARHGQRLSSLIGRRFTSGWLVWDHSNDTWFADCPVVFDFDGEQVEVNHRKFTEVSITWNSIDTTNDPVWPTSHDFRLTWRADVLPGEINLRSERLNAIDVLEWIGDRDDLANGTIALSLVMSGGRITVYNALDENGIKTGDLDSNWHRCPLH
ncbi:hypothetical protein SAMN05216266_107290 [Amycolatopsis marina]|uniref:Uncharacterized protein n=1 Tax=Amycolatopsis marina TaxID=490629 RepID=A0A1I0ZXS5_9PSEU|nr:hypothetical protein [Amycolatopsis marina]SFB29108.1 hypothetical protein SAMN05216266_107290 [Amycolatopsis marina]